MNYTGNLLIDSRDAFTEYGIFVEKGGYKQLVQYPAFKKLTSTEWAEFDGIEIDLSAPVLQSRTIQIQFCIVNVRYAEDFFDEMSNGAYHEFYFADLKRTFRLRMTQNGSFSQLIKLGKLTVTFSDDFPNISQQVYYNYGKSGVNQFGYELDSIDFSQFGAFVLKGTDESIRKAAQVRSALSIDSSSLAGLIYDSQSVRFKTKDIQMKLLINTNDIDEFWKRYDALFCILTQSETRKFYFEALGIEYECYYKSSTVQKFEIMRNRHIWCEFTITLTVIDYRPCGQYLLLATEDYDYVVTEQEQDYIRIRPKGNIYLLVSQEGQYITDERDDSVIFYLNI